ncbi:ACR171Cp [Eremothecium gossypii ATCC 10895]|uniref:ACR171Cp n=1 Tax=Eremothecium gossypii (strain ATCC 10895 / CBS 109.51 / FGSC 9923 / NRRL Y-1056) TaxID=284811 RepID=Q75BV0_EREGS|nr:ACR171Cp [Eremothecium gossypii ATCC 10895]AAS51397.1 ACR171Cp [Eremothecium gossypii ATCC 10895]
MPRLIIVTGVSRGIGRSVVEKVCRQPDTVVLGVARSEAALQELRATYGEQFEYVVGDVASEDAQDALVARATAYGRIDAVVANAGVLEPVQDVNHIDVAAWRRLYEVNFFSVVGLVGRALPLLKKAGGSVVFVSSGASTKAYSAWGAYGSSKAALNHFAMTLAAEEPAVRAVAVAPGVVDTQMQNDIRDKFGHRMAPEALRRFTELKKNSELLDPQIPATIFANLALRGIPDCANGKYLRYNDDILAAYAK